MKPTIIESPFAGDVEANVKYARLCMRDSLMRGESPYASHLLYTQPNVLDDNIPSERELGINAGFEWKHMKGVHTVFYIDKGWSSGMQQAFCYCVKHRLPWSVRILKGYSNV